MFGNKPQDEHRKYTEWIWPHFAGFGGLYLIVIIAILSSEVLRFFSGLADARWISCYVIALAVAVLGVSLIFFAKLPLYRQRRFFTFGTRALPQERRPFYRWGYGCMIFAIVLLLCLQISRG